MTKGMTEGQKRSRIAGMKEPKMGGVAPCPKCGRPKPRILKCQNQDCLRTKRKDDQEIDAKASMATGMDHI